MQPIETPRLLLRGFRNSDLDDFYNYAKHPEVGPNAGWAPHESRWDSKRVLSHMIHSQNTWALVEKETNTVIGSVSAMVDSIRVGLPGYYEIGYAMGKPWWGKGYMTEAVNALSHHLFERQKAVMLSARRHPKNLRSGRVLEKCGFVLEGTLRHTGVTSSGKVRDTVFYSMLPEEYQVYVEKKQRETDV